MHRQAKGFTLIELMLAMTFVSILLVAIAMLTIQISNIYTRGITLKQVNEAGLELSNDLQRSIQSGEKFSTESDDNNANLVYLDNEKMSGRLCLGTYSYVWNYGEQIKQAEANPSYILPNHYAEPNNAKLIRYAKVADTGKELCKRDAETSALPDIIDDDRVSELLATGDRDLALHTLTITGDQETGLYAITLTIGTSDMSLLSAEKDQCKPPSEIEGQEEYCSVNTFDIVARAGSKEGARR